MVNQPDQGTDPRRRGFRMYSQLNSTADEPVVVPDGELRSVRGAPPPKPQQQARSHDRERPSAKASATTGSGEHLLGTKRANLRSIQFYLAPATAAMLDQLSVDQDLVYAEIIMDAIRSVRAYKPPGRRRRRSPVAPMRKQCHMRPAEAEEVQKLAASSSVAASTFIRWALETYLPTAVAAAGSKTTSV